MSAFRSIFSLLCISNISTAGSIRSRVFFNGSCFTSHVVVLSYFQKEKTRTLYNCEPTASVGLKDKRLEAIYFFPL